MSQGSTRPTKAQEKARVPEWVSKRRWVKSQSEAGCMLVRKSTFKKSKNQSRNLTIGLLSSLFFLFCQCFFTTLTLDYSTPLQQQELSFLQKADSLKTKSFTLNLQNLRFAVDSTAQKQKDTSNTKISLFTEKNKQKFGKSFNHISKFKSHVFLKHHSTIQNLFLFNESFLI